MPRHVQALVPLASLVGSLGCSSVSSTAPSYEQDDASSGDGPAPGDDAAMTADTGEDTGEVDADSAPPPQEGSPPPSCNATPARGANVPYQEYEAENASTNGTLIGPSRAVNDPD